MIIPSSSAKVKLLPLLSRAVARSGITCVKTGLQRAASPLTGGSGATAAVQVVTPQIAAQPTAALMLQAYIRSAVEYIGTHRMQMMALIEIMLNFRTADGKLRYSGATEGWVLAALETLLRKGQQEGEFGTFDLRVMAVTIRRAIDAVPPLFALSLTLLRSMVKSGRKAGSPPDFLATQGATHPPLCHPCLYRIPCRWL